MPGKILLVDDVTMFLEIQKSFLRGASAQVLTARDGAEALETVHRERPDVVFMDLHMPNLDGAECCRRIKSDPFVKNTPVVLITSAGKDEDRQSCLSVGCNAFLTKPLDRDIFLGKAREFVPSIDRREKRIPCSISGKFRMFGVTLSCTILDISARGAYIAADYPVTEKSVLDVQFVIPGAERTAADLQAKICWVNRGNSRNKAAFPAGFGVEFVLPPSPVSQALQSYVSAGAP